MAFFSSSDFLWMSAILLFWSSVSELMSAQGLTSFVPLAPPFFAGFSVGLAAGFSLFSSAALTRSGAAPNSPAVTNATAQIVQRRMGCPFQEVDVCPSGEGLPSPHGGFIPRER